MSLRALAKMLGVPTRLAEDALFSERSARAALSRRGLFAAGAALAAGSLLVGGPLPLKVFYDGCTWCAAHSWADYRDVLSDQMGISDPYLDDVFSESEESPLAELASVCWDPDERAITDNNEHTLRAPLGWWAKREGRGILFGTEY